MQTNDILTHGENGGPSAQGTDTLTTRALISHPTCIRRNLREFWRTTNKEDTHDRIKHPPGPGALKLCPFPRPVPADASALAHAFPLTRTLH